jgi:hypothetical protein
MRLSRACALLLIVAGMAACAAPRNPEPVATTAGASAATPATPPVQAPKPGTSTTPSTPTTDPNPPDAALTGAWGGLHVLLTLSADGGRIDYDCAQGTIDEPLRPDSHGNFHVRGHYTQHQGGPARVADEPPAAKLATYDGTVSGDRMQLRLSIDGESLGSYALQRGADPQMVNCL